MCNTQLNQPVNEWRSYLRTAADDQDAMTRSLATQREEIQARLYSSSLIPVGREYIDIGSATIENQEGFRQLLADAEAGLFTHLAISSIDRLGRTNSDISMALRALVKAGIMVKMAQVPDAELKIAVGYTQQLLIL